MAENHTDFIRRLGCSESCTTSKRSLAHVQSRSSIAIHICSASPAISVINIPSYSEPSARDFRGLNLVRSPSSKRESTRVYPAQPHRGRMLPYLSGLNIKDMLAGRPVQVCRSKWRRHHVWPQEFSPSFRVLMSSTLKVRHHPCPQHRRRMSLATPPSKKCRTLIGHDLIQDRR